MSFESAWTDLDQSFQASLRQAWASLLNRGLPVGAALSLDGVILSVGRNRVYDGEGGADPLQGTPIAHAEMNAIAAAPRETPLDGSELWTTHAPCSMCAAAIDFVEIGTVHYLASDPSDGGTRRHRSSGRSDPIWIVVANTLFLHNIAWVGGRDHPMLAGNSVREPGVSALALALLEEESFTNYSRVGADLEDALRANWGRFEAVARDRGAGG